MSTNNSSRVLNGPTYSKASIIGQTSFNIIIITAALVGNVVVIAAVISTRKLRKPTNYFITSLAVSDILIVTTIVPFHVYHYLNSMIWDLGPRICKIWIFMDFLCGAASTTNVALIAVDRLLVLSYPFVYQKFINGPRSLLAICLVWCYAAILSSLSFTNWSNDAKLIHQPACKKVDKNYYLVVSVLGIFLPLVILIVAYSMVFKLAFHQAKMIKVHATPWQDGDREHCVFSKSEKPMQTRMLIRELKATKTLMIVVGTFLICWFPLFVVLLVNQQCPKCISQNLSSLAQQIIGIIFVFTLPRVSTVANPIIYTVFNREFRAVLWVLCNKLIRVIQGANHRDVLLTSRRHAARLCEVYSTNYTDSTTNETVQKESLVSYGLTTTNEGSLLTSLFARDELEICCHETSV